MIVDKTMWGVSMGKLKRLISMMAITLCASACFAKQLCFQIVQHDTVADAVTEKSYVVEDEVLNSFFDYGYIVTNADAAMSDSDDRTSRFFKDGLLEAFNGYSDYFIQINLYYERPEDSTSPVSDLKTIDFTLANTMTGTTLAKKKFANIKDTNKKDDLKKISSSLVAEIHKALIANKA